ncbi:addiction module antidote protein [Agrobacterium vitis]|uniref:addiction module antidote protein n=1 Tax=Agrobacterium vitis TaxID=373 RepID=UPI0012E872E6|nr:addiction module antidote protein [Agrobacterium vitis]MVA52624.1 putative addiction module antidote protein [Agrobacterium vitis]MVA63952.1 putative addiction module antidote protein [Agrobacterium vitis]
MNTVFIGGSRHISRLPAQAKERLNNIIENGHNVVVGDANGADKAVQKHFLDAAYEKVTVFCSGDKPRNNLGEWRTQNITPPRHVKGFQFYAAKDREMAREADFGFMIWDGKSPGTVLNVLRLIRAGKKAVLLNVPEESPVTFKTGEQWSEFLARCSADLRENLRDRATPDEWEAKEPSAQPDLLETSRDVQLINTSPATEPPLAADLAANVNAALASGDPSSFIDALGHLARAKKGGMTQIAKETGLARESLYRALGKDGNPELVTILKVISALGLTLEAKMLVKPGA